MRLIGWLARRFGAVAVLPLVLAGEAGDSALYHTQPEARAAGLDADEWSHARVCRAISTSMRHGLPGEALARLEGRHRATGGNALRAAVLGVNDGLVSNLSLVMGVAGASAQPSLHADGVGTTASAPQHSAACSISSPQQAARVERPAGSGDPERAEPTAAGRSGS